jgi:hypothetical protein
MMRAATAAICVSAFAALGAADAGAAQRYAAPGGAGTACFQNAPCSLETAVGKAKSGDEVIVGAGTHIIAKTVESEATDIDIHGDPAGPMPTVVAADSEGGIFTLGDSRIAYLALDIAGFQTIGITCDEGDLVERVRLVAGEVEPIGILIKEGCAVQETLIRASGEDAIAILALPRFAKVAGPVRNVTAIATGVHSVGIATRSDNPALAGNTTLDLRNAIASGGENDLRAADSVAGRAHIAVANSNFDVASGGIESLVKDLGGNQGAPPLFVDAAAGDFHQAPGSPTIDAGSAEGIGATDLDGNARFQGPAPDIGAYELAIPPLPSGTLRSLRVGPRKFRSISVGDSTGGGILKSKPPVRTGVSYALTAAATVKFTVERRTVRKRKSKKPKVVFKRLKGGFSVDGGAGANRFTFTGKVAGRALKRGRYRLVGTAGGVRKRAPFQITGIFRPAPK